MALNDYQFNSIVRATARLRAKGKQLNFSKRVKELRDQARSRKATSYLQQPAANDSELQAPQGTPNATG